MFYDACRVWNQNWRRLLLPWVVVQFTWKSLVLMACLGNKSLVFILFSWLCILPDGSNSPPNVLRESNYMALSINVLTHSEMVQKSEADLTFVFLVYIFWHVIWDGPKFSHIIFLFKGTWPFSLFAFSGRGSQTRKPRFWGYSGFLFFFYCLSKD